MNSRIVRKRQYHCYNNELVELSVLHYKKQEVYAFVETLMPHAIQIRQTGGRVSDKASRQGLVAGYPHPGH